MIHKTLFLIATTVFLSNAAIAQDMQNTELLSSHNFNLPAMKVTNQGNGTIDIRIDEALIVYPDNRDFRMDIAENIQKAFNLNSQRMVSMIISFKESDCTVNSEDLSIFSCSIGPKEVRDVRAVIIDFGGHVEQTSDIVLQATRAIVTTSMVTETFTTHSQTFKKASISMAASEGEKSIYLSHSSKSHLVERQ